MKVGFCQKREPRISRGRLIEGQGKELSQIPEDEMKAARKWQ